MTRDEQRPEPALPCQHAVVTDHHIYSEDGGIDTTIVWCTDCGSMKHDSHPWLTPRWWGHVRFADQINMRRHADYFERRYKALLEVEGKAAELTEMLRKALALVSESEGK